MTGTDYEAIEPRKLLLEPIARTDDLVQAMRTYEDIKRRMLSENDVYMIGTEKVQRIRKSGWRKLAFAFNISDRINHEERVIDPGDPTHIIVRFEVEAYAPNGRMAVGVGSASSRERKFAHLEHDLRALAHTRAKSRAIADLLGSSDQIADDMEDSEPGQTTTESNSIRQSVPTSKGISQTPCPVPDSSAVRETFENYIGSGLADRLEIEVLDLGIEVFLPKPTDKEMEVFHKAAWSLDFAVSENAKGAWAKKWFK